MNSLGNLKKPFFILAPMDDVTDTVFRQVIADIAPPDIFFTEFTNVDGLQSPGRPRVQTKLQHTKKEQPLIAQIWGIDPEKYRLTAEQIASGEFGEFAAVDINMGCPVKDVIKNGACSALINDRELTAKIIKATKEGLQGKLPITIKTRLGFHEVDYSWHEFLLNQGIDMLTVHGRTKLEMSKVPANWEHINEVRKIRDKISPNTLIVGNGDVSTREQGIELTKKYKLDGVMVGRGIFTDPYIFAQSSHWSEMTPKQKLDLYEKHVKLYANTWNGIKPVQILNKFCKIYVNNFEGASEVREKLMAAISTDNLLELIQKSRKQLQS